MNNNVISDNWSLQNIVELLDHGIDDSSSHFIAVDKKNDCYQYQETLEAIIATEALFDLITDIILRDQILVDEAYINAWNHEGNPFQSAVSSGAIRTFPFLLDYKKLEGPREEFIKRLSLTSDLKKHHEENRTGFAHNKIAPHAYLSQTLWGGAGMLARGYVYEKGYTPHPVRKRFFTETGILKPGDDSVMKLNSLITNKRATLASTNNSNSEQISLNLNMPPLPIRVIQESTSPSDIIKTSLELRDEYQELRTWLNYYQIALSDGSYKDIKKFTRILDSISKYIDSNMGIIDPNAPTFTASIGVFKVAVKGQPINSLANQFGVRSMVNKLILNPTKESDIKKYLDFFGHRNSAVGLRITEHFSQNNIIQS